MTPTSAPLFSCEDLSLDLGGREVLRDIGLDLRAGEVLGVAGLVGSGRTELARLVYGADHKTTGSITLNGIPVAITSPRAALDAGIAYLTEDRKSLGLFLDMSIATNVSALRVTAPEGLSVIAHRPPRGRYSATLIAQ